MVLLTGAGIFSLNAQTTIKNTTKLHWRVPYVDVFSQPNDTTLNWYGSGDVNGDGLLIKKTLKQ